MKRHLNQEVRDADPDRSVQAFAEQFDILVGSDLANHSSWEPSWRHPAKHTEKDGAEYVSLELDYQEDDQLRANRTIAAIQPGNRTELAYWTKAAPEKQLTVHRGIGRLVIGDAESGVTALIGLDAAVESDVTLPPGTFYTFEADPHSHQLLVVSGYYEPPLTSWDGLKIEIEPGQRYVTAPEDIVEVPVHFLDRFVERSTE